MATFADLLYVALFAVAGPVNDYAVLWPAFRRLSSDDPPWARRWLWASAMGNQWTLIVFGAGLWLASGRSWTSLGFTVPGGWRLWTGVTVFVLLMAYHAWAITTLVRSADARASMRQQIGPLSAVVPHTRTEMYWFGGVSLTAGFCEEFLYRGYFIWVLSPWLGWWGAAALSVAFFASGHAYQGWNGVLRTGILGAALTVVVALFASLWPAIALHALVDVGSGFMAWLSLRERPSQGDVMHVEQPTEP
jgi:membrane protease YdiL (CAAX protease family)